MKARTAVQITLTPKDYRRAKRLARQFDKALSTYLREAALASMQGQEEALAQESLIAGMVRVGVDAAQGLSK